MSPDERALLQRVGVALLQELAILTPTALFYGMFIVLFSFTAFTLLQRGLASRATQAILGLTLIAFLVYSMFCISLFITYVLIVKGVFVDSAGILDESTNARVHKQTITNITVVTTSLIPMLSDGVVIWRAWVLYLDKKWIMLIPCALLFGAIGATMAYFVLALTVLNTMLEEPVISQVFAASLTLSLGTNVIATSLIFYRLWSHLRFVRRMGIKQNSTSPVQKILIVLVESGLAYCALQITMVTLEFVPSPPGSSVRTAGVIVLAILTCVTAMYPSIVVVLVSLQRSTVETFGFSTQVRIQTVQDIELSSVHPASPGRLSVAGTPLEGKTHV